MNKEYKEIRGIQSEIYALINSKQPRDKIIPRIINLSKRIAEYYSLYFNDSQRGYLLDQTIYGPGKDSFLGVCKKHKCRGTVIETVEQYEHDLNRKLYEGEGIILNGSIDFFKNQISNSLIDDKERLAVQIGKLERILNPKKRELTNINSLIKKHPDFFE